MKWKILSVMQQLGYLNVGYYTDSMEHLYNKKIQIVISNGKANKAATDVEIIKAGRDAVWMSSRVTEVVGVDFSEFVPEFTEETVSLIEDAELYAKIENYLKYRKLI